MRILLLLSLSWVIGLTAPLFTVVGQEISGRDVILILGGLFLLGKSTYEIHENLEGEEGHSSARVRATFGSVLVQIVILDLVFSLEDRKSTRLNSSHANISYAVFCLKKKKTTNSMMIK